MTNIQSLPMGLPVLGEGDGQVALCLLQGGHDEVDGTELSDRLEPPRDNRGAHPALGRLEVVREDVARAHVFGRHLLWRSRGPGIDVDKEGLEGK